MWSREAIKSYAKNFLRRHYWKAFLVCLIFTILSANGDETNSQIRISNTYYDNQGIVRPQNKVVLEINNPILNLTIRKFVKEPLFLISRYTLIILGILLLVLRITVGYNLEVGQKRFFLKGFKDDVNVGNLFSTFNSNEYFGIVKVQFLRGLYTFLWSLLLVIPGIIKSYEYRMVPYILSEEPNLTAKEALRRSKEMTDGQKMDIFILDLSFWGWYILGLFLLGIGGIFVDPYREATFARLYNILSDNNKTGVDGIEGLE